MKSKPPILFYIPKASWPEPLPEASDQAWPGYKYGIYAWTLQTFNVLSYYGHSVQLIDDLEGKEGIIIGHKDCLVNVGPAFNQLLVCMQADWGRHLYSHIHFCQNPTQTKLKREALFYRLFWPGPTYFVRHWPELALIQRDSARPAVLKTLAYYGREINLAKELQSPEWEADLASLGIAWKKYGEDDDWRDYSAVDGVVIIRDFQGGSYDTKPATKYFNACLAGCVPICGMESSLLFERKHNPRGLFVSSYSELLKVLKLLSTDTHFYSQQIQGAKNSASNYSAEAIVKEWSGLLDILCEEWQRWNGRFIKQRLFVGIRKFSDYTKQKIDMLRTGPAV